MRILQKVKVFEKVRDSFAERESIGCVYHGKFVQFRTFLSDLTHLVSTMHRYLFGE